MSPQAALAKEIAGMIRRNVDNTDPSMLVRNVIPLDRNEALMLVGILEAVASAESFTEQKVYEALYPDSDPAKPIRDFLSVYAARLEAVRGVRMRNDETAFDYRTRSDSDGRLKLTNGQVRAFIDSFDRQSGRRQ
ncbi:hypothetical protein Nazgul27 [Burkholderia phage BcepNazgul]|uniref:Uncharacterized protein n=1 Tax=Burkholderia phage BcepNazgul TaxID=242861 RepID=Q6UYL3_9CAUD|nr:hypothetical protein Nazgul27 [Burkholderia phage BcepNazgul]AAQ63328.1 conserved hypothetical protein [Burkholderia phage BcepNazgul]